MPHSNSTLRAIRANRFENSSLLQSEYYSAPQSWVDNTYIDYSNSGQWVVLALAQRSTAVSALTDYYQNLNAYMGTSSTDYPWPVYSPYDMPAAVTARELIQIEEPGPRVKARALLKSLLPPAEWESYERNRYFHVIGGTSGKRYRIQGDCLSHNIKVMGEGSAMLESVCCHPIGVPFEDVLVTQALHLQFSEREFLAKANVHPLARDGSSRLEQIANRARVREAAALAMAS